MVAMRAGIAMVFVLPVLFEGLRDLMEYVAVVLIVALVAVILQTNKVQTQKLRKQTLFDLGGLITVVPVSVLNGFVAADTSDLLPAERAALLQTGGVLLIVVAVAIWLGLTLFPDDRTLVPAVILPNLIIVIAVTFVLHDFRNQTVLAMIAVSYFIGAAAIAIGALVDEPVRRHVPVAVFGSTVLAGLVLFDPGMRTIFDLSGWVQFLTATIILLGLATLIVVPNPEFDNIRLSAAPGPGGAGRSRRREREADDSGGDTEE